MICGCIRHWNRANLDTSVRNRSLNSKNLGERILSDPKLRLGFDILTVS